MKKGILRGERRELGAEGTGRATITLCHDTWRLAEIGGERVEDVAILVRIDAGKRKTLAAG